MEKYRFSIEEKVTIWNRLQYEVTANSKEEAEELIILEANNMEMADEGNVRFVECEMLFDTEEGLTPKENGGCSTIEVIDNDSINIWTNE